MKSNEILDYEYAEASDLPKVVLINPLKFSILAFLSLGIYCIWWMYKVWKFFKEKNRLSIYPAVRAILSIFFLVTLLHIIQNYARRNGYSSTYSSVGLYVLFIGMNLISQLAEPLELVSVFSFVALLPAVKAFNYSIRHSDQYFALEKSGFNTRQLIIVILGSLLWLLIFIGLLLPEEF